MKILIIEDSPSIYELLSIILGDLGHTISINTTGDIAKENADVDCIICDYNLPAAQGDLIIKHIREVSNVYIIAHSSDPIGRERMLVAGANIAINKTSTDPVGRWEKILNEIIL
jgi:DNA-binding response OmpR family regulator